MKARRIAALALALALIAAFFPRAALADAAWTLTADHIEVSGVSGRRLATGARLTINAALDDERRLTARLLTALGGETAFEARLSEGETGCDVYADASSGAPLCLQLNAEERAKLLQSLASGALSPFWGADDLTQAESNAVFDAIKGLFTLDAASASATLDRLCGLCAGLASDAESEATRITLFDASVEASRKSLILNLNELFAVLDGDGDPALTAAVKALVTFLGERDGEAYASLTDFLNRSGAGGVFIGDVWTDDAAAFQLTGTFYLLSDGGVFTLRARFSRLCLDGDAFFSAAIREANGDDAPFSASLSFSSLAAGEQSLRAAIRGVGRARAFDTALQWSRRESEGAIESRASLEVDNGAGSRGCALRFVGAPDASGLDGLATLEICEEGESILSVFCEARVTKSAPPSADGAKPASGNAARAAEALQTALGRVGSLFSAIARASDS